MNKLYKLTNEELQFLNDNLNKSELVVYLYLRIQSNRITDTQQIASDCSFSIRTVQKAISKLKDLKLVINHRNILEVEV